MRYYSIFTGFGAFEQAVKNLRVAQSFMSDTPVNKWDDWECVGYSEIDPYAIKVFEKNHPGYKNYGDIRKIIGLHIDPMFFQNFIPDFDLLVGGSPCQDLSIAKKGREGLKGSRSSLFWEFVRLLELKKPKYFLLENVASMKREDRDIISKALGVEPVCINASLQTAQQRKRLFWCNWEVDQPEDRHIYLRDILESGYTEREKSLCITKNYREDPLNRYLYKSTKQLVFEKPDRIGDIGSNAQAHRVYSVNGKSVCLSALGGGQGAKTGLYLTAPLDKPHRIAELGDRNKWGKIKQGNGVYSVNVKSLSLTTKPHKIGLTSDDIKKLNITLPWWTKAELKEAVDKGILVVRKLTPVECERLQGFPDGYTDCVSNTRRYMGLGNAFCVPVIKHIIKSLVKSML